MKVIKIKLLDENDNTYFWRVWRENAVQVGRGLSVTPGREHIALKPRNLSGWTFKDHEGYERFSEGNWQVLVTSVHQVAKNYGLRTKLS